MSEEEFVRSMEACQLSADCFHHRDHIRLAWIYVRRHGDVEAEARIAAAIRAFAAHLGKSEKYHHTMTIAWLRLVAQAARAGGDFEEFSRRFPALFDKSALSEFYSEARLQSEAARTGFVEPDLKPLSVA